MLKSRRATAPRTMLAVAAVFAVATTLAACETVQGVGRDVQSGGDALEDTSEDVQREM